LITLACIFITLDKLGKKHAQSPCINKRSCIIAQSTGCEADLTRHFIGSAAIGCQFITARMAHLGR
jgi:hypothetical protein